MTELRTNVHGITAATFEELLIKVGELQQSFEDGLFVSISHSVDPDAEPEKRHTAVVLLRNFALPAIETAVQM